MEMKRLSLSARQHAAHKAQDNPHGAVVVMILFLIAFLLAARSANAQWAVMNKDAKRLIQETLPTTALYISFTPFEAAKATTSISCIVKTS